VPLGVMGVSVGVEKVKTSMVGISDGGILDPKGGSWILSFIPDKSGRAVVRRS
jgi:hypothetical protein